MRTKKVTLKELRQLESFTGINKRGVKAVFTINADKGTAVAEFEDGETREMKLDSVRRSWLLVEESEENKEEESSMQKIKAGYKVKDSKTGWIGVVTAIHGRLITVENSDRDFPADVDNLTVLEKTEVEQPKQEEAPKVEKVEKPKAQRPAKKGKGADVEPESKETEDSGKKYREQFYSGDNWSYHRVTDQKGNFIRATFIVNEEEIKLKSPSKRQVKKYLQENLGIEVNLK